QREKNKWYKKPTASNRLLHYESDHNLAMKKNIAINMIKKFLIANNGNHNDNDMQILINMLTNSGYPHNLIKKIFRVLRKQNNEDRTMVENEKNSKQSVIVIPHVNELTEELRHFLKKFGVRICTKLNPSIGDMVNKGKIVALNNINKNKTSEEKCIKTGEFAVYGLPCECGDLYTGETVSLHNRIKQYKMKIKKFDIE
ncbi:unnamed protein product, partial [Didymodactylos carnosus]